MLSGTMAEMAHFSFPYNFTIPNSEFRNSHHEFWNSEFGIAKYNYAMWESGNSLSTSEGILNLQTKTEGSTT